MSVLTIVGEVRLTVSVHTDTVQALIGKEVRVYGEIRHRVSRTGIAEPTSSWQFHIGQFFTVVDYLEYFPPVILMSKWYMGI